MVSSVRTRAAFAALSGSRHRGRHGPVWVSHVPAADPRCDAAAVAYAVGRSVGTAVVRNRVRRRLRAVIRELDVAHRLPPGLYLVGVRPDVVGLSYRDLTVAVTAAIDRATQPDRRS